MTVEAAFICCHCDTEFTRMTSRPGRVQGRACPDCKTATKQRARRAAYARDPGRHREHSRKWRERNQEYVSQKSREWEERNREARQAYHVMRKYNLSPEQYEEMLSIQGGVCAICQKPESMTHKSGTPMRLSVDHDHSCCPGDRSCGSCVRGLLCTTCNRAIAPFEEPETLERLVKYLTRDTLTLQEQA